MIDKIKQLLGFGPSVDFGQLVKQGFHFSPCIRMGLFPIYPVHSKSHIHVNIQITMTFYNIKLFYISEW